MLHHGPWFNSDATQNTFASMVPLVGKRVHGALKTDTNWTYLHILMAYPFWSPGYAAVLVIMAIIAVSGVTIQTCAHEVTRTVYLYLNFEFCACVRACVTACIFYKRKLIFCNERMLRTYTLISGILKRWEISARWLIPLD